MDIRTRSGASSCFITFLCGMCYRFSGYRTFVVLKKSEKTLASDISLDLLGVVQLMFAVEHCVNKDYAMSKKWRVELMPPRSRF